jgi:hypothetical protein
MVGLHSSTISTLGGGKMKYVEASRTAEPHSECILFLYLQDARGVPVANVKMKIWAGPPPTGQPPYFVDDEPNNPNRLTDADGKFQFIVANPAPADPLDFYVQALGPGDVPQSETVHFLFPAHEARWVIVTLAEEGSPAGDEGRGASAGQAPPSQKPFAHYLLFGPGSQPGTLTNLIIALDYILRFAPLVGFSTDEAKNAQHVTIVGDTNAVSSSVEQSLRDLGCIVARLAASDSYALENVFKHLIDSGSPYPSQ